MKYDIEYEIWRFDELYHGFEMGAKENLPAGSMLAEYDESVHYVVQRFFHREETKKTERK